MATRSVGHANNGRIINQNTPSDVTHVCRSKGFLLCNGNDSLITSSVFDLSQVFDSAASMEAVVVLSDKPGWIVATAQGSVPAGSFFSDLNSARIYLSKDNGITWSRVYTDNENVFMQGLEYMGAGVVLAGTGSATGKILRSTDYGATWATSDTLGSSTSSTIKSSRQRS